MMNLCAWTLEGLNGKGKARPGKVQYSEPGTAGLYRDGTSLCEVGGKCDNG